jgi:predicted GIY-YIG superfamily endonuclease
MGDEPDERDADQPASEGIAKELRQVFRQDLQRRAERLRRDQEALQTALRMIEEGKSLDEIRAILPERPDRANHLGPGRRGRPDGGMDGPSAGPGAPDRRPGPDGPNGRGPDGERRNDPLDALGGPRGPEGGPDGGPRPDRPDHPDRLGDRNQRPREDRSGPISDADRTTIHDFLKSTAPRAAQALEQLEKTDAPAAERKYREILPRIRMFTDLRERDPEAYDFRLRDIKNGRESIEAARALARLEREGVKDTDDRYTKERERLRLALEKQYDSRTDALKHELDRMRDRLRSSEQDLADRPAKRATTIEKVITLLVERERKAKDRPPRRHGEDDGDAPPPPPLEPRP